MDATVPFGVVDPFEGSNSDPMNAMDDDADRCARAIARFGASDPLRIEVHVGIREEIRLPLDEGRKRGTETDASPVHRIREA